MNFKLSALNPRTLPIRRGRPVIAVSRADVTFLFQTLGPALQNLLKSSLPLQDALSLPFDYMKKQNDLAKLLPRPLFVLYLQASGYQEACGRMNTKYFSFFVVRRVSPVTYWGEEVKRD